MGIGPPSSRLRRTRGQKASTARPSAITSPEAGTVTMQAESSPEAGAIAAGQPIKACIQK